ncbi:MAG: citrate/2-methylcitrate synthase, partial [Myxococcota bacterium]
MTDAKIIVNGNEYELPVVTGSEGEVGIDMAGFRAKSKTITLDPGFGSTGSAKSAITYIDGENGVLHYRGYPIEQLAGKLTFEEVIYLLIWGELPTKAQLEQLNEELAEHSVLPEAVVRVIHGLPRYTHPMATAQAATAALSANAHMLADDKNHRAHMVSLIAKMKALTAGVYRDLFDYPLVWPNPNLGYAADFLNLMYARPGQPYEPNEAVADAFNKLLILHADHEQNCSASAVRTVASSQANLYASVAAGIGALWGPLHGGANQRVLEMLEEIHNDGGGYQKFIAKAKDKNDPFRLMGFGHRVYKNYDPRAKILKESTDR